MRKQKIYFIIEISVVSMIIVIAVVWMLPHFIQVQSFGILTESESTSLIGTWEWKENVVTQTDESKHQTVLLFQHDYHNIEIEMKANAIHGMEGVRIVFGYQHPKQYLLWNIGGWNNTCSVIEMWNELQRPAAMHRDLTPRKSYNFTQKTWHDIRLLINSDEQHLQGYIDNELILDTQLDVPIDGKVGVSTWYTTAKFKDVIIKPLRQLPRRMGTNV